MTQYTKDTCNLCLRQLDFQEQAGVGEGAYVPWGNWKSNILMENTNLSRFLKIFRLLAKTVLFCIHLLYHNMNCRTLRNSRYKKVSD